jgi:hypothetical protein
VENFVESVESFSNSTVFTCLKSVLCQTKATTRTIALFICGKSIIFLTAIILLTKQCKIQWYLLTKFERGTRMNQVESSRKKWVVFTVVTFICTIAVLIGAFFAIHHMRENYAQYTPDEITQQIMEKLEPKDLAKVDAGQISKHYEIPDGVIESSSLYMSKSSESASELACFLLTDTSKYDQLKHAINTHISAKAAGFKTLNPAQYNALKNVVISQKGRYVLVSVGSVGAAEEKLFLDLLNEKSS